MTSTFYEQNKESIQGNGRKDTHRHKECTCTTIASIARDVKQIHRVHLANGKTTIRYNGRRRGCGEPESGASFYIYSTTGEGASVNNKNSLPGYCIRIEELITKIAEKHGRDAEEVKEAILMNIEETR